MAPEILVERGHSFPVDWWALGILTYEMIVGFPPFYTGTQNNSKMYELIKKKAVYFPDPQRHNIMMSENCKNFITRVSPLPPLPHLSSFLAAREKPRQPTRVPRRPRGSPGPPLVRGARPREDPGPADRGASKADAVAGRVRREQLRLDFHDGGRDGLRGPRRQNAHHQQ